MKKLLINFCLLLSASIVSAQTFNQSTTDPDTYYSNPSIKIGIGTDYAKERFQIGDNGFTFHDGGWKILGFNYSATNSKLTSWMHSAAIEYEANGSGNMRFRLSNTNTDSPNITALTLKQDSILIGDINKSTDAIVSGRMLVGDQDNIVNNTSNTLRSLHLSKSSLVLEGVDEGYQPPAPYVWSPSLYISDPNPISPDHDGIFIGYKKGEATISANMWGNQTLNLYNTIIHDRKGSDSNYRTHGPHSYALRVKGRVHIGDSSGTQAYKLYVTGGINATKVKVATIPNWGDFVFDNDYQLSGLEETEQFIKENKHLPEIPSAEEIEKEGIEIGEMQRLQMIKIEELTLHLIEMNKEKNSLKSENQLLKEKLEENQKEIAEVKAMLNQLLTTK